MSDRWDDLRADLEPDGIRHSMVRTTEVRDLLAERDALAAEVERLRALAETVHEYIASAGRDPDGLAGEDVWLRMQCRAAALTEGDDHG